jgi:hypothetical protein
MMCAVVLPESGDAEGKAYNGLMGCNGVSKLDIDEVKNLR